MSLMLGVDTGGTCTDAVLIRDEAEVVAKAKALTSRPDLSVGIGEAVAKVLQGVDPASVGLAALSTTLATNALVEGQGERVALVLAGLGEEELERAGLAKALGGDPVLRLPAAMNHAGEEAVALDLAALDAWLDDAPDVAAYAVAGLFAVRNPAHERRIAARIRERTGRPVSSSHQLSARLGGPRRALTAVLNARLVGMIDRLIAAAGERLAALGVEAPLMVVRGDGALISAAQAREAPIETILSGPAASIVGARWLTGLDDAFVADIGGTTTDIAVLRGGRPKIDPLGAKVGGWRTMVEAVAMRTHGLGGDSEVRLENAAFEAVVRLGPRRVLPVALAARSDPRAVHAALDRQLRADLPGEHDGRFVRRISGAVPPVGLGPRESALLARIGEGLRPLDEVIRQRVELGALERLRVRGLVQLAGVTPTDAAHVLGRAAPWDAAAAGKALQLLGRRRTAGGMSLGATAEDVAGRIADALTEASVTALMEAGFEEDGLADPAGLARHPLVRAGLSGHRGAVRLAAGLGLPAVGLGASAATWYPAVGSALGTAMVLPEHADVANAIGAVVGRVSVRREGSVTQPSEGCFRAHLPAGPADHATLEAALDALAAALAAEAEAEAARAGAVSIELDSQTTVETAEVDGRKVFIAARVVTTASGRPAIGG